MNNYILNVTSIPPLSKEKPKQVVILCHGYGGDGKDISTLTYNWKRFLPNTVFYYLSTSASHFFMKAVNANFNTRKKKDRLQRSYSVCLKLVQIW